MLDPILGGLHLDQIDRKTLARVARPRADQRHPAPRSDRERQVLRAAVGWGGSTATLRSTSTAA